MQELGVILAAIGSAIATIATTGAKGVWVWGHHHRETMDALVAMTKDRDFWRDRAWRQSQVTDVSISVAEDKARSDGA